MNQAGNQFRKVKVWDLPLRIFHWALLLLVAGSFLSEWFDNLDVHAKIGYAVLTLLLFRVLWGFVGGTHSRFASFVRGPSAIRAYLSGSYQGLGHNPIGALSVLALLLVLLAQAISGLFTSTDEFFEGPLAKLISSDLSAALTEFHEINSNVLWALVGLHVLAVFFYRFIKKDNLILPMLSGKKSVQGAEQDAQGGSVWLGLIVFALAVAGVWWVVNKL